MANRHSQSLTHSRQVPSEGEFSYEHVYTVLAEKEDLERPAIEDINVDSPL